MNDAFNPVLPKWERDVQFHVDQESDNIRVKPTTGKTSGYKSFLGSSERICRNRDKGSSTFCVRISSWFCNPLE